MTNHGPFVDVYQIAESFLISEKPRLALQFETEAEATTFRARFHKWRKKVRDQGNDTYDAIKVSKSGTTLTLGYSVDPQTLKPIGFTIIDPETGEEFKPPVTSVEEENDLDLEAREFANRLGKEE